jgi:GxxExxY protein
MHPDFRKAQELSYQVIGAAIEAHRDKGPGLIESIYEWCFQKELQIQGLKATRQDSVIVRYKGFEKEEPLRLDLLVEDCLLIEAKAVTKVLPIHKAQLLSHMKLLDIPVGLLINFHEMKLADGVYRMILKGADKQ